MMGTKRLRTIVLTMHSHQPTLINNKTVLENLQLSSGPHKCWSFIRIPPSHSKFQTPRKTPSHSKHADLNEDDKLSTANATHLPPTRCLLPRSLASRARLTSCRSHLSDEIARLSCAAIALLPHTSPLVQLRSPRMNPSTLLNTSHFG
jgi:hypothetical protein